jgi:hypothetical protein
VVFINTGLVVSNCCVKQSPALSARQTSDSMSVVIGSPLKSTLGIPAGWTHSDWVCGAHGNPPAL